MSESRIKHCSLNVLILAGLLQIAVLELQAEAKKNRKNKKNYQNGTSQKCILEAEVHSDSDEIDSCQQQLPDIGGLEISPRKNPSSIVQVLETVLRDLRPKEDQIKKNNQFIDDLVKKDMIDGLKKQSKAFEMIYQKIAWTGSVYEGLKISDPDEFDLNLVLNLPISTTLIEISSRDDVPSFVTVKNFRSVLDKIEVDPRWKPAHKELVKWTDESGNLLANKVREWMESIAKKFINDYNKDKPEEQKLNTSKAGPAIKFKCGKLSIDVVPVFGFTSVPPSPIRAPKTMNREWFIVPKPVPDQPQIKDAWRVSLYEFEKDILKDCRTIKPAIKLIKKLRDGQDWKSLYSYSIKTAALWMMEETRLSLHDPIQVAFLKLLKGVQEYLRQGVLPFYWDKRANLLVKMKDIEKDNLANRIAKLIKKIEENWDNNPSYVGELIGKN